MTGYTIREIKPAEVPLLEDFLYEAIYQRDEANPLPREIIDEPAIKVFIDGFGKPDDFCLVAEADHKIVGAVWARILAGEVKGFGNIDDRTPEFAISLYKDYRSRGIGTALMKNMLQLLKGKGYARCSLAVQKDNYAVRMYENVGFVTIRETEEEYIMVCELA